MRKLIYLIVLVFIITACEDRDHPKPDYIMYYEINDTVEILNSYNIFNYAYFAISETNDGNKSFLHYIIPDTIPEGITDSYDFLINNNQFVLLNEGDTISSKRYFSSKDTVYLDNFAGKGKKYIGYMMQNYISGGSIYHCYGWIKVSLSADKKLLHIIGRAINESKENAILAGQME
ncbi:MAG: hypothetical protein PHI52_05170 [Bacteroidales bacterium]|nr:hypothetical protein [Bacteroidales bacterium]